MKCGNSEVRKLRKLREWHGGVSGVGKGGGVVYKIYTTDVWGGVGSSEVRSGL